jgi:hypothetical protein
MKAEIASEYAKLALFPSNLECLRESFTAPRRNARVIKCRTISIAKCEP